MAATTPKLVITQDIPNFFYSYEVYDLKYSITRSIAPISIATISYQDANGNRVEVYNHTFSTHPAKIEDIGSILEPYAKAGTNEFTLSITSTATAIFTKVFTVGYILPTLKMNEELESISFSSALERLTLTMMGTRTDYSAKFELRYAAELILSETYIAEIHNGITIYDLSSLIEPYLQDKFIDSFDIGISIFETETGNNIANYAKTVTSLYSRARINMPAADFICKFFLSTLMGDKVTSPGRKEYLHFVTTEKDFTADNDDQNLITVQISADWIDGDFSKSSEVLKWYIELTTTELQKITVDISPDKFKRKGFTLIGYTVVVGERKQRYIVDNDCLDTDPAIAFVNSFGCLETFYFTGTNELEPSFQRDAAYINGKYRNYHVEEERNFKADTGVIPESMSCLVDDLTRATDIYLIEKGEIGREITITNSETKRNNNLDSLFRASITYRIADRNQNELFPLQAVRTFDKTFDNTFK